MTEQQNSSSRQIALLEEIQKQRKQLSELAAEHKAEETKLRRRRFKMETEVENWLHKYDTEMREEQALLEEIQDDYDKEKEQLHELEERFSVLEKKYSAIMDERHLLEEERQWEEEEKQKERRAAVKIQALWRGYWVRKTMCTKKGKGKGKKGTGKGKKGGKKKK